jgi:broad specificity phosphatase PhoE
MDAASEALGVTGTATTLWCVRHGQSRDNARGVFSNRAPGAGLTDLGVRQASGALDALWHEPVSAVYASPARRAVETAAVIARSYRLVVREAPGLLEYDFGELEGSTDPGTGRRSLEVLAAWLNEGRLDACLPGGETGNQVVSRFVAALEKIAARHQGSTVVLVGHVGTMTVGLVELCDDLHAADVWGRPLPHGAAVRVTATGADWSCTDWPRESAVTPSTIE